MTTAFDAVPEKAEYNQYWYSAKTINALLREITHHATRCAFLSTPSLFFALDVNTDTTTESNKTEIDEEERSRRAVLRKESRLFEYDSQWSSDTNYVAYDYHAPERLPVQYAGYFDYVVADPPFITAEVWQCYLTSVKWLLKKGGKVLFTTVLENHAMLEAGLDGPLFIPLFKPCIPHLTYQYMCFLNYEPTTLNHFNDELPPVTDEAEVKLLRAIAMANEIRQSETAFAQQLAERNRAGERGLPTAAFEREQRGSHTIDTAQQVPHGEASNTAVCDWTTMPLEKMPWGHIPDYLRPFMYPAATSNIQEEKEEVGAKAIITSSGKATDVSVEANMDATITSKSEVEDDSLYGVRYVTIRQLREQLDAFKRGVDAVQKLLDQQMRSRIQRVKLTKQVAAEGEMVETKESLTALSEDIARLQRERETQLESMSALAQRIRSAERSLAEPCNEETTVACDTQPPYLSALDECLKAYATVEVKRAALQELAAEATRKYKSPLFHRMRELLQEMKTIKSARTAVPSSAE